MTYRNQNVTEHHTNEHLIIEFEIADAQENDLDGYNLKYEFLTPYTKSVIFSLESDKSSAIEFTDRDNGLGVIRIHKSNFSGLESDTYNHRLFVDDNVEDHVVFSGTVEILS